MQHCHSAGGQSCLHAHRTVGTLALLQKRSRLLPFKGWTVRPTGGRGGSSAAVTLLTGQPKRPVSFSAELYASLPCMLLVRLMRSEFGSSPYKKDSKLKMAHCPTAGSPDVTLVFSVTGSGVQLVEPDLPGLRGLPATAVPITALLRQLSQRGVHVLPGSQDAEAAGVKPKVSSRQLELL